MRPVDDKQQLAFLRTCSDQSLADFVLAKAARDRQLSKDLQALLDRAIENRAHYMLGSLLRNWRASDPARVDPVKRNTT